MESVLVAATSNAHKIREIEAITARFGYRIVSRAEAGVPDFEVEENGATFEENSLIKAKAILEATGKPTIADDSGLVVDALNGAPGVFSARFANPKTDSETFSVVRSVLTSAEANAPHDDSPYGIGAQTHRGAQDLANNVKLLEMMQDVPDGARQARFVSVITMLIPGRQPIVCRGEVEGQIAREMNGSNGFGYDPLFIPNGFEVTFGLISEDVKNEISHRYRALAALAERLKQLRLSVQG